MLKAVHFAQHRSCLIEKLQGGVICISAYTKLQRSGDMAFAFEQESNFWWLTGIEAPDWWVIIDGARGKEWLVAPPIDEMHQVFDGALSGAQAMKLSGVDAVVTQDEALDILKQIAKNRPVIYTLGDHPQADYFDFMVNPAPKKMHTTLSRIFSSVRDCRKELAGLRAIKRSHEIAAMQAAIDLTVAGFADVRSRLDSFTHEYQVEAAMSQYFRSRGAIGHAYDPIVAGGRNACTLHYVQNNSSLKRAQMLLIDVGARQHGYAADITRTYALPMATERFREVHAAVRVAQQEIVALLKPHLSVEYYQHEVDRIMKQALRLLGLLKDDADEERYRRYFPHAISHGLGVDVHDSLGAPKYFIEGMVVTVEPGIYIPEESIGVRIEDDILITAQGAQNLSAELSTGY